MVQRLTALLLLASLGAPAHAATRWLTDRAGAPIHWQDWGGAVIERSRKEGRPIFLSIGSTYSNRAYRMHREAFLNGEVAETMNNYFAPVLLDPIEHPEIAEAYVAIARAMVPGIEAELPLNLILTSSLEPFAAAGALKTDELHRLLVIHANRWAKERQAVLAEAHANVERARASGEKRAPGLVDSATMEAVVDDIGKKYGAETMLDAMTVSFLFDYAARTKHENIRGVAEQTLRNLAILPIRDQLGGGFHHTVATYEKLLPDQALLAHAYLDAWQITRDPDMAHVARTTLDYVVRDLQSRDGAFDASQDAHNLVPGQGPEFVNGSFYLWTTDEVLHLLGAENSGKVGALFGLKQGVLNRPELKETRFLRETYGPLAAPLAKMLEVRQKRPAPFRESIAVAGWSGLMISALARGAVVLDEPRYLEAATLGATNVTKKVWKSSSKTLLRTDGGAPALAEDYAMLVHGFVELFQSSYDVKWLELAIALQQRQDALFWDQSAGRYATGRTLPAVLHSLLRESDDVTPAASSVAARNLLRLSALTGNATWRSRADMIVQSLGGRLRASGAQLPQLAAAYETSLLTPKIVVVTGDHPRRKDTHDLLHAIHDRREPMRLVVFLPAKGPARDRVVRALSFTGALVANPERAIAYVCTNGECRRSDSAQ